MTAVAWRCNRCHTVTDFTWPLTTIYRPPGDDIGEPVTHDLCCDCATALTGVLQAFVAGEIGELGPIPDTIAELEP